MILAHLSLPTRSFLLLPASFNGGETCGLCRTFGWDRLLPVVAADGGDAVDEAASPDCLPLCRSCGYSHEARLMARWPVISLEEYGRIWEYVRQEQAREAVGIEERLRQSIEFNDELKRIQEKTK